MILEGEHFSGMTMHKLQSQREYTGRLEVMMIRSSNYNAEY